MDNPKWPRRVGKPSGRPAARRFARARATAAGLTLAVLSLIGVSGAGCPAVARAAGRDAAAEGLPDFDGLWDFGHPAATEQAFRALVPRAEAAGAQAYLLALQTQIARTLGLQGAFAQGHALLDSVAAALEVGGSETSDAAAAASSGEDEAAALQVVGIRALLERGRLFNSAGEPERGRPLFQEAWERARAHGEDCYAIDAAHMLAILGNAREQLAWSRQAIAAAEASAADCARRWLGPLYHNTGMTHLEAGDLEAALDYFARDWRLRQESGSPQTTRIAKWCVAHALRRMGRLRTALAMQRELESESKAAGEPDGFVYEEIAECLLALEEAAAARPYFARAHELLGELAWLAADEPERLARLARLAGVDGETDGESRAPE